MSSSTRTISARARRMASWILALSRDGVVYAMKCTFVPIAGPSNSTFSGVNGVAGAAATVEAAGEGAPSDAAVAGAAFAGAAGNALAAGVVVDAADAAPSDWTVCSRPHPVRAHTASTQLNPDRAIRRVRHQESGTVQR